LKPLSALEIDFVLDFVPDIVLDIVLGLMLARSHADLLNQTGEFSVLFSRASDHHPRPIQGLPRAREPKLHLKRPTKLM
jgi:hypothetical protein